MPQILTKEKLIEMLQNEEEVNCYILLNHGIRSSKVINNIGDGIIVIRHESDDTETIFNSIEEMLSDTEQTNLKEALNLNALFMD